jgi:hypothetical protein
MPRPRTDLNSDYIVNRYLAGVSVLQIAEELHASRPCIIDRLVGRNVHIRSHSEAYVMSKSRHADGMEGRNRGPGSKHERRILGFVRQLLPFVWQKAIGPHNVDLALIEPRVAVEVQRERPRKTLNGRSCSVSQGRLEYILNAGWNLLVVYCPPTYRYKGKIPIPGTMIERCDCRKVSEKVISFAEFCRRNKSTTSQYGMIDGHGKPTAILRVDLHDWARVPGF